MSKLGRNNHVRTAVAAASLMAFAFVAEARPGCDDRVLPPDQRWNGATSFATPELARFYAIGKEMTAAYVSSNTLQAEVLAKEYLQGAMHFPCNWNYGNAIHDANAILGLLALHSGRTAESGTYLIAAGRTPGSPQLNSFGPSLLLARELAQAGDYRTGVAIFHRSRLLGSRRTCRFSAC
jgi:hypothetical protein